MSRLGIGLIGTGYMGKCHALAWTSVHAVFGDVPSIDLVHLSEVTDDLARQRAGEFGFARSGADWRALVADPEVDIVSITTPNQFHAEMAIAALEAGKHVWCEKPMATSLADAERMRDAARISGRVAVLGYNYIQNPMVRQIEAILAAGNIGTANHFRVEMDEDFMADPATPFGWKSDAKSGYGALDDFGVHPVSLIHTLLGRIARVLGHQAMPYATRPIPGAPPRAVETHDIASVLCELDTGASGVIALSRSAWGRKGRIALQIFGDRGAIVFDQERFNELQLYTADGDPATRGFRTILAAPVHAPYDRFIPAPGHGLGFNDLKIIECHELLLRLAGRPSRTIGFDAGLSIERTIWAMHESAVRGTWTSVPE
ncbi:MAG: Gfo/Idh/MocA family oxidoreductase [Devosia sp.]|uniref:Gfo/Idh/MocA family protein n=1 Tax=Devosia sp. 66-22 TaxID=1895753 RepID=UPI000A51AA04|nr:Gfo/Idh/MocA family oxidoreductase [Devosia sp. 66-22]MBN9348592.1 Gfo/Idh/MocA family oxidoreductase [Devosia sp.]